MGNDIERNHFELLEDINKKVEDLIVQALPKPEFKIRKGSLGGDMVLTNAGISPVGSTPIMVPQDFKESVHILMSVNIPEQFKKEKRRWIISRRAFDRVTVSSQRPDKGKVNKRGNHLCKSALDISIGQDGNMLLFKAVIGKKHKTGKRDTIGN